MSSEGGAGAVEPVAVVVKEAKRKQCTENCCRPTVVAKNIARLPAALEAQLLPPPTVTLSPGVPIDCPLGPATAPRGRGSSSFLTRGSALVQAPVDHEGIRQWSRIVRENLPRPSGNKSQSVRLQHPPPTLPSLPSHLDPPGSADRGAPAPQHMRRGAHGGPKLTGRLVPAVRAPE
eukprot:CAMPEP_0113702948 /NCGR_PEP_ID=MMETSP0038_2-20120614/25533_1 /TAXON_ID=2898 /ORGANISM="Cryptomonas paramecium" /LENGTH=175 /DNA_ID=CAMNT_0000627247 /DNA_START=281 /DNA_END=806 /DNA_ORIENTATION=+ /assembly_acc=CAM_ASM_000170